MPEAAAVESALASRPPICKQRAALRSSARRGLLRGAAERGEAAELGSEETRVPTEAEKEKGQWDEAGRLGRPLAMGAEVRGLSSGVHCGCDVCEGASIGK